MKFAGIDYDGMRMLCYSLEVLNMSNTVYIPNEVSYITNLAPYPSIRVVDISQTDARYLALRYLAYRLESSPKKDKLRFRYNFEGFPSLEAIHANSLEFGIPDLEMRYESGSLECKGRGNIKKLFMRNNKVEWLNISCESCGQMKLELMDISGNGLEYISPEFLGYVTTLEDIRLNDNKLISWKHMLGLRNYLLRF